MGIGMQSSGKSKKKEEELRKQGCRAVAWSKKREEDLRKQGCRAVLRVRRRENKVEGSWMLSSCLE